MSRKNGMTDGMVDTQTDSAERQTDIRRDRGGQSESLTEKFVLMI